MYVCMCAQALLLLLYALLSGVVSAYSVALNSKERDARFCYDNAVPLSLVSETTNFQR